MRFIEPQAYTVSSKYVHRGAWVAQSAKQLTLDFTSGHDLAVPECEPGTGLCADSSEPGACFGSSVPLSLPLPKLHALSLSFKNK